MNRYPTSSSAGIAIKQDSEGRYCLNDFHKAAGGEGRHQPALFLRLQSTNALIYELIDQSTDSYTAPINTVRGGTAPGTFVAKELVYAYASKQASKQAIK